MRKQNVLILCTGNSVRSQMAEGFLRSIAGDRFEVYSAGLKPVGVNPLTVQVMAESGIDIRQQHSKSVKEYLGRLQAKYVITVCQEADQNCPMGLWSSGQKLYWPFDDPAAAEGDTENQLPEFRRVRDEIRAKIIAWLAQLEPVSDA